jgi:hypothetical protein
MVILVDQIPTPVHLATPRPGRRRLVERYAGTSPSTRQEMSRAYNAAYRENLLRKGIPDRRQLAEAVLQAVIEQITSDPSRAKITLRQAAEILRSVTSEKGQSVYTNGGIKFRIAQIANSLPTANS